MMTNPETKRFLSVPFEEKDQAKALGVRWDPLQKRWWIPSSVDAAPFARWVQIDTLQEPLYRDLVPIDRDELEGLGPASLLEIFFVPWTCWKCHGETLAFHGAAEHGAYITPLFYQAAAIEELDKIRREFDLSRFGCIKPRFSRTVGVSYVSQGCRSCDALIGDRPLYEDFCELSSMTNLKTYPYRRRLNWHLLKATQT